MIRMKSLQIASIREMQIEKLCLIVNSEGIPVTSH